ncbi:hypothetical protein [Desulfotomaculum copahuensis]|uniref:Uncharacterized protein n=1 Tax=Desulfotomaculum copahuensis TaxID=1838280 RepID=A0A1B7LB59_9FIRM|nr:hypothetical protein [Desulfotomaculum copahuensis]OAT79755.1 hypothetical protein A6M21_14975 [Desulfotomaculum copahuensis]
MLINTEITLAMRCPVCGKLGNHPVPRFAFSGGRPFTVNCSCGALKLAVAVPKKGRYCLQVPCVVCGEIHPLHVPGRHLWSGRLIELFCTQTGIELGWLGSTDRVRQVTHDRKEDLSSLINEFATADYFHNNSVMCAILKRLHILGEQGEVYCRCGNGQIEVDIFPDRLELHCADCEDVRIIYAETEADCEAVKNLNSIVLNGRLHGNGAGMDGKVQLLPRHSHR